MQAPPGTDVRLGRIVRLLDAARAGLLLFRWGGEEGGRYVDPLRHGGGVRDHATPARQGDVG